MSLFINTQRPQRSTEHEYENFVLDDIKRHNNGAIPISKIRTVREKFISRNDAYATTSVTNMYKYTNTTNRLLIVKIGNKTNTN